MLGRLIRGPTVVIALAIAWTSAYAERAVEEVVVTGSYIGGSAQDAASPVQILTRDDILAQGAMLPSDVFKNLEMNRGSTTNMNAATENFNIAGKGNVNLRGLGLNSTLVLMNSKRHTFAAARTQAGETFVDIDEIPIGMIERIEVLKNGASATYGSDAIAGVVNFITRNNFEGFELNANYLSSYDSDQNDVTIGGIYGWGSESGKTHVVLGVDYLKRNDLPVLDRNVARDVNNTGRLGGRITFDFAFMELFAVGTMQAVFDPTYLPVDINGNPRAPATVNPAFENAFGNTDPLCSAFGGIFGRDASGETIVPGVQADDCREDTRQWSQYVPDTSRVNSMLLFSHEFADYAEVYGEGLYSETNITRTQAGVFSPVGQSWMILPVGVALAGLGGIDPVTTLPRPNAELPLPANAPVLTQNGGFGNAHLSDFNSNLRGVDPNSVDNDSNTKRFLGGLRGDFDAAGRSMKYDVSYSYSENESHRREDTLIKDNMELAINGLGGPDCVPNGVTNLPLTEAPHLAAVWNNFASNRLLKADVDPEYATNSRGIISQALSSTNQGMGGCMFFNPFLSAYDGSGPANDPTLLDWMILRNTRLNDSEASLKVFDAVFSSEMFQFGDGNQVQGAFGIQWRENSRTSEQQPSRFQTTLVTGVDPAGCPFTGPCVETLRPVANDALYGTLTNDFDGDQTTLSVFAEMVVPFGENLEVQLAARWEDIEVEANFSPESLAFEGILDTLNTDVGRELSPKVAVRWQAHDWVAFRASWSQSFRAPNLGLLLEGSGYDGAAATDKLKPLQVRNGSVDPDAIEGDAALESEAIDGFLRLGLASPSLDAETADSYSIGFILAPQAGPLDGFNLTVDYFLVKYEDAIVPEPFGAVIDRQVPLFRTAAADPNNYISEDNGVPCAPGSLPNAAGISTCVVDPNAYFIPAAPGAPAPLDRIGFDGNLGVLRINDVNAASIDTDGVDLSASYRWEVGDIGQFSVGTLLNWIHEYNVEVGGTKFDAAGHTNDEVSFRPMPALKGSLNLGWVRGNHAVTAAIRHIGSYDDDINGGDVDSYSTFDMQYSFSWQWRKESPPLNFTAGGIDLFEADIPQRDLISRGFDTTVYNANGRRYYFRLSQQI